jgi:hypothetical protein
MICKANTLFSPIHDGNGPEHKLRYQHGIPASEITPGLVTSFKAAMNEVAVGAANDPDW